MSKSKKESTQPLRTFQLSLESIKPPLEKEPTFSLSAKATGPIKAARALFEEMVKENENLEEVYFSLQEGPKSFTYTGKVTKLEEPKVVGKGENQKEITYELLVKVAKREMKEETKEPPPKKTKNPPPETEEVQDPPSSSSEEPEEEAPKKPKAKPKSKPKPKAKAKPKGKPKKSEQ